MARIESTRPLCLLWMGVYFLYIDNGHAPNPKTLSTSVPGILTLSEMNMLTKYIHKSRVGEFMAHVRLYSDIVDFFT